MELKNPFLLLFLWKLLAAVQCDELVAIITPKTIYKPHTFSGTIQTKDVKQDTELAVQLWNVSKTYFLNSNNTNSFEFATKGFKLRKLNFSTTLYREKTKGSNKIQECSTYNAEIKVDNPIFYTFIQTDKPIYNPRDEVKFRIIIVDKDLRPRIINNIDIEIVDPLNRTIMRFTDLEGKNHGVYVEKFALIKNPLFGNWKIRATIDKLASLTTSKLFSVQKYELPLFGVDITASAKDYLVDSKLEIKFNAKYAFGELVNGNAKLIIQNITDEEVFYEKIFENVDDQMTDVINMKSDFNKEIHSRVDLKATLIFTELQSGLTYNKSTEFAVHPDSSIKITPVHPKEFTPGFPFDFSVFVQNWKNESYNSYDEVEMDYIFKLSDGTRKKITFHPLLDKGVAKQYTMVPIDAIEFEIQCRFLNSRVYRVKVGMANPDSEAKRLNIDYTPKSPQLGNFVDMFVSSDRLLGKIIVAIMTKYGNTDTRIIDCRNEIVCSFSVDITEEMIPKFSVEVYHVMTKNAVDYGSVEIVTENIGKNYLNMNYKPGVKLPRAEVNMTFETTKNSRIFLLAVDKRIKYLNGDNDIQNEDIMKKVGIFDTKNLIILDDMSTWHQCTEEEVLRIENGRNLVKRQSGFDDNDEVSNELGDEELDDLFDEPVTQKDVKDDENLREEFPKTWLFETIETKDVATTKTFKVPDSMTSWYISAFSIHDSMGLGLMKPQELIVKKEFFVKFTLPFSLRYTEILRVDVLVFNYNKDNKAVDATIKMINLGSNQFEFVEYDNCTPSFSEAAHSVKSVNVPVQEMKRVSFYIRSRILDNDFTNEKFIKIRVFAEVKEGNNTIYKDLVQKSLRIENFGVKLVDIDSVAYSLAGNQMSSVYQINSNDTYTNPYCLISGDYLSEKINLNSEFEFYPNDLLEHKVAKFKWNTNVFQYFKIKNNTKYADYLSSEYQEILTLRVKYNDNTAATGFIAFLVDTLATAMNNNLMYKYPEIIETELNILKKSQLGTGEFVNFGNVPEFSQNNTDYNNTKRFFETAYVLIAFLKSDEIVEQKYEDVIDKGLKFLIDNLHNFEIKNEATAVAAYAFSLKALVSRSYEIETKKIMDAVEKGLIDYGGNEMCVKVKSTDEDCNLRHTAYAAMTYLNINQAHKAVPLIHWLLKSYNFNVLNGDYYNAAIMSEPIATAADLLKTNTTDITILLNDEFTFEQTLRVTKNNSTDLHTVNFPDHSKAINSTVYGHGFISITKIFERTLDFAVAIEPTFHISVDFSTNNFVTKSGEIVVHVCANYSIDKWNMHNMDHVVYEVHMPSGYEFIEIIDLESMKKDVKLVKEGKRRSFVMIYFMNFRGSVEYCINIRAVKKYEIKNPLKSSVKVFNFDEKKKFGVAFYDVPRGDQC